MGPDGDPLAASEDDVEDPDAVDQVDGWRRKAAALFADEEETGYWAKRARELFGGGSPEDERASRWSALAAKLALTTNRSEPVYRWARRAALWSEVAAQLEAAFAEAQGANVEIKQPESEILPDGSPHVRWDREDGAGVSVYAAERREPRSHEHRDAAARVARNVEAGQLAVDDSWITVRPNGPDATGSPVLLDDRGRVKAGMGGKFTGRHIAKLKSKIKDKQSGYQNKSSYSGGKSATISRKKSYQVGHATSKDVDKQNEIRSQVRDQVSELSDKMNTSPDWMDDHQGIVKAAQEVMAGVARYMGMPERSDDYVVDVLSKKMFNLGGKELTYAGSHDPENGKVTIYLQTMHPDTIPLVVTHEFMHKKFETILKLFQAEKSELMRDYDRVRTTLKPDDSVREGREGEVPFYARLNHLFSVPALEKDDGCSDYSREWWAAFGRGEAQARSAIHETLAEMATLDWEGILDRLVWYKQSTKWRQLYRAVNDLYAEHVKR
jgi:hypothetical protein